MTGDNDESDAGDPDEGAPDPDEPTGAGDPTDPTDGSDAAGEGDRDTLDESGADAEGGVDENAGEDDGDTGDTEPADEGGRADEPGGSTDGDDADGTSDSDAPGDSGGSDGSGGPDGSGGAGGPGGDGPDEPYRGDVDPERVEYLASELADLQEEVDEIEEQVEDKTVHRDDVEAELRRYVRARQRKGHVTGWGPYLVLLYGVVMTLGAFYYLGGVWAILAMLIVWLSTLGLYVFMAVFSTGITVTRRVAALRNTVSRFRN